MKMNACNIFPTNLSLKMMQKSILSISEVFSQKMVEEICTASSEEVKAVFCSSGEKTDRKL